MGGDLPGPVTELLARARVGDRGALDELLPLVYEELRVLARARRRRWTGDETLDTTALVHEAYLRLVDQTAPRWSDRAHFLAVASRAMRHILIDYARRQQAEKRGGGRRRLSLEDTGLPLRAASDPTEVGDEALLALEESLKDLERENERQSRIVECRFFGGMTIRETAAALGISTATVERGWSAARLWLYRDLRRSLEGEA